MRVRKTIGTFAKSSVEKQVIFHPFRRLHLLQIKRRCRGRSRSPSLTTTPGEEQEEGGEGEQGPLGEEEEEEVRNDERATINSIESQPSCSTNDKVG